MSQDLRQRAIGLLQGFKGEKYSFGSEALQAVAEYAAEFGSSTLLIANQSTWLKPTVDDVRASLAKRGIGVLGGEVFPGARPNSPKEDVYRLAELMERYEPDSVVVIGGGSSIDAVKAANVLASLGSVSRDLDTYFGTGQVTEALQESGRSLIPMIAVQTAASSAAHLTKYSNVTDVAAGQKKLIVDEAVIPACAVFDYEITESAPRDLTLDGAFDGLSHCLEVLFGASGADGTGGVKQQLADITLTGIELIVQNVLRISQGCNDKEIREALGLGTDLGGYAIMVGGTNGAHLTSFSLTKLTTHGRACAIMNPYYTVFFAPAIEDKLRAVGRIYQSANLLSADVDTLSGRELGEAVAQAMLELSRRVGFPTTLSELQGWDSSYIDKALSAAKNPQLEMKLKNMPEPLSADSVDEYMGPVLRAAADGDFTLIKNR